MLHKLLLSVALVAGTLGATALTTSTADAATPAARRQVQRGRAHGRYQGGARWQAHRRQGQRYTAHRHHGRGRYHAHSRQAYRR